QTQVAWRLGRIGRLTGAAGVEGDRWHAINFSTPAATGGGGGGGGSGVGPSGPLAALAAAADTTRSDAELFRWRVALEYGVPILSSLELSAGVLHERQTGGGTEASGTGTSLGLAYRPTARITLRAAYGNRFRFPSVRQLFDPVAGAVGLLPERSEHGELGVEVTPTASVTVGVTGFVDEARNFIDRPAPDDPFVNEDRYHFRGIEAVAAWRPAAGALARAGYSYLDSEDRSPGREGLPLEYRPRHKLTLEGRYAAAFGLETAASLRYEANQVAQSRIGPLRQIRLPDFAVVSGRASQWLPGRRIGLYVGVENLFAAAYEDAYGFPQAGRVLYAGVELGR
ncbi:MAG TPA: TonB-dependent receptor, partial [Gemmatimonadales bacterium]|nr:TonB-dependent receptor [Gemmatimonadales bacterium]